LAEIETIEEAAEHDRVATLCRRIDVVDRNEVRLDVGFVALQVDELVGDDVVRARVIRSPCYVTLATLPTTPSQHFDGVTLVAKHGRSLSALDVTAVLGAPSSPPPQ
jgi:hypothetical protein